MLKTVGLEIVLNTTVIRKEPTFDPNLSIKHSSSVLVPKQQLKVHRIQGVCMCVCTYCCHTHTSVLITGFSLSVQEGLIALWDCDDESKENALDDKTTVAPAVSSKPQVDRLWHRIIEDRMVVGVMLTADSSA